MPDSPHIFAMRVYYDDTDAGGIVYHANYLRFAERARTEALRDLGVPHAALVRDFGLMFVVRRVKLDYLRPARVDDSLTVLTSVSRLGSASVGLTQVIMRADERLAVAEIGLACVEVASARPRRLPAAWQNALRGFSQGVATIECDVAVEKE
jgi:acyl-CoA thioester hydrolase